jgi:anthranilate phosphoribosyltransferase
MGDEIIQQYVTEFRLGCDVDQADADPLFASMVTSTDKESLIDLLRAWNEKGFAESELFDIASVMRRRMLRVTSDVSPLVDIVGTGAAATKTFNVSTVAALIVAGAGISVAKHGNRAATSRSGSADALTELGIQMDDSPSNLEGRLQRDGICFLFAPNHHSLSPTLATARRDLGQPSIFNCLGPLCNPASPTHSVIGVSRRAWLMPMANAVSRIGTERTWVVYGESGLDELALTSSTAVADVVDGAVTILNVSPNQFDILSNGSNLPSGCSASKSADAILSILSSNSSGTDAEDLAVLNAAAAIHVSGSVESLPDACEMARESVRSGAAMAKLEALRRTI